MVLNSYYQGSLNLLACSCNVLGTTNNSQTCDQQTGNCFCKQNIEGEKCNECTNGFYLFPTDQESHCLECPCDVGGAYEICEKQTGKPTAVDHVSCYICLGIAFANGKVRAILNSVIRIGYTWWQSG